MLPRGSPVRDSVINGSGFPFFRLLLGAAFTPSQSLPHRWGRDSHGTRRPFATRRKLCEYRSRKRGREGWGRYWEHTIRDDHDFAVHFDYIHFNPVKQVSSVTRQIGRIRRFAGAQPPGCIPPDGSATGTNRSTPASANEARMGSARDPPALAAAECAALFRPTLAGVGLRASEIPQDPHATKTPSASPPMSRSVL